jgi:ABC-2 type transport system ATP-binding protein
MWDVIRGLVREGTTLLLTTQYLEEADELADMIAVVDHGRIIARGTADELKRQIGGERIEVVVRDAADIPRVTELMRALDSAMPMVNADEHTRRLSMATNGGTDVLLSLVRQLAANDIGLDDIALHRPTLDDVFLSLTGRAAVDGTGDDAEQAAQPSTGAA